MADFPARLKPKKSSVSGEVPQASDLEVAEIAVNTADGKLFVKHTDDSIKEISGSGGGATDLDGLTDVDAPAPTDGQGIAWFDDESTWKAGPTIARWEYTNTETYADDVSVLLNFNNSLQEEVGLTASSTGTITYDEGQFGSQAAVFDGGSTVYIPADTSLDLPGDFTIEGWYYFDSATGSFQGLAARRNYPGPDAVGDWVLYVNTTGIIEFADLGNNVYQSSSLAVNGAAWNHIAVTREASTVRIFLNGSAVASFTMATDFTSTEQLTIGQASTGSYLAGRVEDFRITKGVARYTTAFTVPSAPLSLGFGGVATMPLDILTDVEAPSPANGQVLTWSSTRARWEPANLSLDASGGDAWWEYVDDLISYDGATDGQTMPFTNTGNNPGTQSGSAVGSTALSKFGTSSLDSDATSTMTTTVAYGGDPIGTNDFTLEGWFYYDNATRGSFAKLFAIGSYSDVTQSLLLEKDNTSTTVMDLKVTQNSGVQSTVSISNKQATNTWQHVALVRRGSDFFCYMDGSKVATLSASGVDLGSNDYQFGTGCTGVNEIRFTRGYARYWESTIEIPSEPFPAVGQGLAVALDDLSDVEVADPGDGTGLVWAAHSSQWVDGPQITRWVDTDADPYANETVLLLNFNSNLVDATGRHTPAISGTTAYGEAKYGTASLSLDGSSEVNITNSADFSLSGDFTIEFWVKPDSIPTGTGPGSAAALLCKRNLVGAGSGTWGMIFGETSIDFQDLESITKYSGSTTLTAGVWQHVAVTRSGTTLRMFLDGVEIGSWTSVSRNFTNSETLRFGRWDSSGSYRYDGLVDDLRITKGIARYTAAFTPPAAEMALAGLVKTPTMPLDLLTDVDAATPTTGQVLTYDGTVWAPADAATVSYDRVVGGTFGSGV